METTRAQTGLGFKVHFTNLIEEIITVSLKTGRSGNNEIRTSLLILRNIMGQIAARASEINDPEMNRLMCRLALYAISDPKDKDYDPVMLQKVMEVPPNQRDYNITHETAMVAAIMSDHILNRLYEKQGHGYVEAVSTIAEWAVEFEEKHRDVDDWDEFNNNYKSLSGTIQPCAWDDIVMDYAEYKLQNL